MAYEFKLPSLGDGVTGKVLEILVKPGDQVKKDQNVLIVGTDKVDAEIPVDVDGTVEEVLVKKGDDVTDGALILRLQGADATAAAPVAATPAPAATPPAAAPAAATSYAFALPSLGDGVSGKVLEVLVKAGDQVSKDQNILIVGTDKVDAEIPVDADGTVEEVLVKKGDEVTGGTVVLRMTSSGSAPAPAVPAAPPAPQAAEPAAPSVAAPAPTPAPATATASAFRISPLARKRAKELGVNLSDVRPAEGASRISYKDVVDYIRHKIETGGGQQAPSTGGLPHKKLPDFAKFGEIERQPQSRIGVLTAENMHYAFNTIPHAWISEKADITQLEKLRQQYKDQVKAAGGNLTTTAIITKAVSSLLKKMPQFNASYDAEKQEIIFKKYVNVGIAVDTPRGLLVPVIRNTDQKGLQQIAIDLTEISTRTRDGKNKPDDLDGGTFTISNIGGIGGTNMLSIVNWPQVAILSITAASTEAVWNGTAFEPRLLMPMTIGWDHRVINGADAARFLVELKKILEEPFLGWM
ncbi:MAG: 2-oxo acid dehydrogenase subunit E2 [Saprospiraceae bacterium]